jgi:hypothetical protein
MARPPCWWSTTPMAASRRTGCSAPLRLAADRGAIKGGRKRFLGINCPTEFLRSLHPFRGRAVSPTRKYRPRAFTRIIHKENPASSWALASLSPVQCQASAPSWPRRNRPLDGALGHGLAAEPQSQQRRCVSWPGAPIAATWNTDPRSAPPTIPEKSRICDFGVALPAKIAQNRTTVTPTSQVGHLHQTRNAPKKRFRQIVMRGDSKPMWLLRASISTSTRSKACPARAN